MISSFVIPSFALWEEALARALILRMLGDEEFAARPSLS